MQESQTRLVNLDVQIFPSGEMRPDLEWRAALQIEEGMKKLEESREQKKLDIQINNLPENLCI